MDIDYFQQWLDKYMNFERAPDAKLFRLETTERLADIFDHPERKYKTYHVAGSKGKGSVAKMLACVIQENAADGMPVGVYASPHVYDFRERVGTASGFLPEEIYDETVKEFTTAVDKLHNSENCGSWFELNVAFAFLAFFRAGLKNAVFEVGMGGRLDATNVIRPEVCVITRIELEHTQFLGNTLEKIAKEKAGIIKEGVPVVVAEQKSESVNDVFRKAAKEKHAPIYFVNELAHVTKVGYENDKLVAEMDGKIFRRPLLVKLNMLARVQAKNALEVAVVAKVLDPDMPEEVIERGLEKARLPGRFEIKKTAQGTTVVLDGAHTPESIEETLATFDEIFVHGKKNLLFAVAEGKDIQKIVPMFKNKFAKIFVTRPGDFKKCDLATITKEFEKAGIEIEVDADYEKMAKRATIESEVLLVTGSFYLLEEVAKNCE